MVPAIIDNITDNSIINLKDGIYEINDTIYFENLNNVTIKGNNNVTFSGGKEIKTFQPLTDKNLINKLPEDKQKNIFVANIEDINLPPFTRRGCDVNAPLSTIMVFKNNKPLNETTYPKTGFLSTDNILQEGTSQGDPSIFEYTDPKIDTWANEKDVILHGYFHWLWADAHVLGKINKDNKTITLDPPYLYANRDGVSNIQGVAYRIKNVFSELDSDSYYIDRDKKLLYIYSEEKNFKIEISTLKNVMIKIINCNNITFDNINFDLGQNGAFNIENSNNITIKNSTIKRFAYDTICVNGGENFELSNSEIFYLGRSCMEIQSGDLQTLKPCNFLITNNKFHDFGLIDHTYVPAIHFMGVGITVSHNEMYNSPSSVIRHDGNDSIYEYNYIHNACRESDDQGTIDLFGNPSFRGNIFKYNFFEDNGFVGQKQVNGVSGIRFDDAISGQYVFGNIFKNSSKGIFGGIQINSGKDNTIENNIFINGVCAFSGGFNKDNAAWKESYLNESRYNDLYLSKYPQMKNDYNENGLNPKGVNYYKNNIIINCNSIVHNIPHPAGWVNWIDTSADLSTNIILKDSDIDQNYKIKTPISIDFKEIPFEKIGIQKNNIIKSDKYIPWTYSWINGSLDDKKRVLLLGDSITWGYGQNVENNIGADFYVDRVATAAAINEEYYLNQVKLFVTERKYHIIAFNYGLHSGHLDTDEYGAALEKLVKILQNTGAKLIFNLTTPYWKANESFKFVEPDENGLYNNNDEIGKENNKVVLRNKKAIEIMQKFNIPVNDLYTLVLGKIECRSNDGVHYNEKGYKLLGESVGNIITLHNFSIRD